MHYSIYLLHVKKIVYVLRKVETSDEGIKCYKS